jgi:hypothetical protein
MLLISTKKGSFPSTSIGNITMLRIYGDRVELRQVFHRVPRFAPVIPPWLSILTYHIGDEQQASWLLQFRDIVSPHDMKMNNILYYTILYYTELYN